MRNRKTRYFMMMFAAVLCLMMANIDAVFACCKPQDCANFGEPITLCLDNDGDGYGNQYFQIKRCAEDPEAGYVSNCSDNCPQTFNPDQKDSDGNGIGDACEGEEPPTAHLPDCCPSTEFTPPTPAVAFVDNIRKGSEILQ